MQRSEKDGPSTTSSTVLNVAAIVAAVTNVVVWYIWRPSREDLTFWPFLALSSLKLLMVAAILWQFREVHVLIGRGVVRRTRAIACWTIGLVAALAVLTPLRERIAPAFDTVETHLVRPSEEIGYTFLSNAPSEEQLRHRQFVVQWNRGEILAIEAALAVLIAAAHGAMAHRFGSRAGMANVLLAGFISFVACYCFGFLFRIVLVTYDTFYFGAMAGPLSFDFVAPWLLYPETALAAPFYVVLSLSSWVIAAGSRVPAPNSISPADVLVAVQPNA